MRVFIRMAMLLAAISALFGCAHDHYNVSGEALERVKVVGVAPFFVDPDSDIRHPEKQAVVKVVEEVNRRNERELTARIKESGVFFAVRQVDDEPGRLFTTLLANRERRDDAGIVYNKYFFKKRELKDLMASNGLDALMVVTVSGLTRKEKVYSSNYLSFLETDFNYLSLTAQLLDGDGTIIWEYPNFRQRSLSYPVLFSLQYPDFDEATANLSDQVDVKFKTVNGIIAAFARSKGSAVPNGPKISALYSDQYDEILSLMRTSKPWFENKKEKAVALSPTTPAPASAQAPAAPVSPATQPAAVPPPAVMETPAPAAAETQVPVVTPPGVTETPAAPAR